MLFKWAALLAFASQIISLKGQKPGECPRIVGGSRSTTPINRCQDDNGCPGTRKCCETVIGFVCMFPESTAQETTTHYSWYTTTWAPARSTSTTYYPKPRPPQQQCTGEGEEYSECAPLCPKGCDNLHDRPTCSGCKPGCKCKKGYHRLAVDDDTSPCVKNSVCEAMTSKENCPDGSVPSAVCRGKHKSCPRGSACVNGLCCPPNARPQPTIKPGQCPTITHNFGGRSACTHDSQCPGAQKCCPTMYTGSICNDPMNESHRDNGTGKKRPLETLMHLLGLENVMNILH
uniref:WAP domain-containing protein n=1 Tax=Trichuris muris TaxID=70415 RepID=A0A5S6R5V5_TRIMR